MVLQAPTGAWVLLFMAAAVPVIQLQARSGPDGPPEVVIHNLVLQPSETVPPTGTYTLTDHGGKLCVIATMGVEFIISEKQKSWYFNLDPSRVRTSGLCSDRAAFLSLTLQDNMAGLELNFIQENDFFYVTRLSVHLSPLPVCKGCANKTYSGVLDHEMLFAACRGQMFTCRAENPLQISPQLKIKLVPLQLQAFTLAHGPHREEVECWPDFTKRLIPIVTGAAVVGLIIIAVMTFLFIKDRRRPGYERI